MRLHHIVPLSLLVAGVSAGKVHQLHAQVAAPTTVPPGTYVLTLKEGDQAPPQAMGEWEFHVDSAGAYRWTRGGNMVVRGELQVVADTVSLVDREGDVDLVCDEAGRYLWSVTSEGLRFAEIKDDCGPRPILLGTRTLRRK